jgi:crotonobetainyl-CoA:carnitine CoA-transferase CaiB-like acyl-CoA transferase
MPTQSADNQGDSGARLFAGIEVVEFGQFIAVPYCAQLLADGGAHVVKIESLEGDPELRDGQPTVSDPPMVDYMCAMMLAFGIASALFRRARTGAEARWTCRS